MIKEIAFVAYSVRDVPEAVAFYRDTLGLRQDGIDSDGWVEFDIGGVSFGIGNGEPLGFIPGKSNCLVLEVDDVAAERTRLLGLGVKVGDFIETPVCFMAFVTDPAGNVLGIHQRKPR
jgi:predicted enzyme related to lactoylglutathione lyase